MVNDVVKPAKSKSRGFQHFWLFSTTTLIMFAWANTLRSIPSSYAFSTTRLSSFARISRGKTMGLSMVASAKSAPSYSEATRKRIKGLDASKELSKLATKMNKSPEEFKIMLSRKLSAATVVTEKEEYMEWLISDVAASNPVKIPKKTKTTKPVLRSDSPKTKVTRSSSPDTGEKQTFQTDIRFDDESKMDMHRNSRKAVAEMGLSYMTEIQAKTFAEASTGSDVLGRARTGTGKTIAFLLPAIERLIRDGTIDDPNTIGMLVVSPTRELATQIGEQAKQLLKYHRGTSVQVVFGGEKINRDINRLSSGKGLPTVLVATPGRLLDHLQTTKLQSRNGKELLSFGKHIMSETNLVVLDETDRLLDMGFRREIEKIMDYLPSSQNRQTLLFSATMPAELRVIMKQNMKPDYVEVDCIQDGDPATHTNDRVAQSHVLLPSKETSMIASVIETIRYAVETHISQDDDSSRFSIPPKIVVFFNTARQVQFFAEIFQEITKGVVFTTATGETIKLPSWELHSKKSQSYRNRVSNEFRDATMGVLFTSDVSARGVDYPNVSQVIQFGLPRDREQYIHRLGRTGRGGSKGRGWLVLQDWEASFLEELKGVDIPQNEELFSRIVDETVSVDSDSLVREVQRRIRNGNKVLKRSGESAYLAFLGYYNAERKRMRMRNAETLVAIANDFALSSGFEEPPKASKQLVGKMGLRGVAGLRVGDDDHGGQGRGGRGGNRGGGRGGRNGRGGRGGRGGRSRRG